MKSKAPLALLELLIALLVFSAAAAWCLQAFSLSERISRQNEARDQAVLQAQNAAEVIRSVQGDWEEAAERYGGSWNGSAWQISYTQSWQITEGNEIYRLNVSPAPSDHPLLARAEIVVTDNAGGELFALSTAWQREVNSP